MNFNWTDNVVTRFLNMLADLVVLNLLWLVFSVPLITIGASTSAMYSVMMNILKKEEGYIARSFIKAFKVNLKKGTAIWCIFLIPAIVFILDFMAAKTLGDFGVVLQGILIIAGSLMTGIGVYALSLQALYENTVINTLKNAIILTFIRLPYTLLLIFITVGAILITCATIRTLMIGIVIWIFIGGSSLAGIQCLILKRVFQITFPEREKIDER